MKALTVRQPWAWALVHGGKDVENRTQAWTYRGPLLIHAGQAVDRPAIESDLVVDAWQQAYGWDVRDGGYFETGAVVGLVQLVGAHREEPGCCTSPWAQHDQEPGRLVHLEVADPVNLGFLPIEDRTARGRLGLWDPAPELLARVGLGLDIARRARTP